MRSLQRSRRRSPWTLPLLSIATLAVGVVATVGTLWWLGKIDLPWLAAKKTEHPPGTIRLPMNVRTVPAYSKVTREDLYDAQSKSIKYLHLPPKLVLGKTISGLTYDGKQATGVAGKLIARDGFYSYVTTNGVEVPVENVTQVGGALTRTGDIIGRVVKSDKKPNYAFTEQSFLPKGTRAGIAGGTPPGMQSLVLQADRIAGIYGLKAGDHLDLIAAVPTTQLNGNDRGSEGNLPGGSLVVSPGSRSRNKRTVPRAVAVDAVLIRPVYTRAKPTTTSSLTQGRRVQTIPVQEVVVAVRPQDVPLINAAMGMEQQITAVTHSGRPEETKDKKVPAGMVEVPLSGRSAIVYSRLSYDDLIDPRTLRRRTMLLSESEVKEAGIITKSSQIIGRVLKTSKPVGQFFTEADFAPKGSPAGLAAGVPDGKLLILLDAGKISGASGLQIGEKIELVASVPVDFKSNNRYQNSRLLSAPLAMMAGQKQAEMRLLVRGGVVVAPVGSPAIPRDPTQATKRGKADAASQFALAVDPKEIAALTEALTLEFKMTAVSRSGSQGASPVEIPKEEGNPLKNVKSLEILVGPKRETLLIMSGKSRRPGSNGLAKRKGE